MLKHLLFGTFQLVENAQCSNIVVALKAFAINNSKAHPIKSYVSRYKNVRTAVTPQQAFVFALYNNTKEWTLRKKWLLSTLC